jgi:hypothetical protein
MDVGGEYYGRGWGGAWPATPVASLRELLTATAGLLFVALGGGLLLCKGTDIRLNKPTTHF